jgi:hypothetical protein
VLAAGVALFPSSAGRLGLRGAYTLSKAFNYANDGQIPFGSGPIDPNDLRREYGPTPNDRRHRAVVAGVVDLGAQLPGRRCVDPLVRVPMEILMPDGRTRIPVLQRNAGGRQFTSASDRNDFVRRTNTGGGINGEPLPLVPTPRFPTAVSARWTSGCRDRSR